MSAHESEVEAAASAEEFGGAHPLLSERQSHDGDNESTDAYLGSSGREPESPARAAALLLLLLLVNLAMSLYQLPLNRVVEWRLCREYYSSHDPSKIGEDGGVDEHLCKIEAVQKSLGSIQGIMETLAVVGDFVMTIPLIFLAQSRGRRLVLRLNVASRLFMLTWVLVVGNFEKALPTRAIIAGPAASFLGGDCVFNSIAYAYASDLTDDPTRRAIYFGYMSSVSYVVALLGPALASATMSVLLWLPFYLGIGVLLMAMVVVSWIRSPTRSGALRRRDIGDDAQRQSLLSSPALKAQDAQRSTPFPFRSVADHVGVLVSIVVSHPRNFTLLLFSMLLTSVASADTKLLVQYISARYGWTFASAGYVISGKAVVNFTLLTVIIPRFLRAARNASAQESTHAANVRHANYCLVASVLGALCIAAAWEVWALLPGLFIYALGSALPIFTFSLLKSPEICPQDSRDASRAEGHLFSIVMLVKTMGSLIGAPLMAALWVRGISIGGLALGMPYLVSAACYTAAMIVISNLSVM